MYFSRRRRGGHIIYTCYTNTRDQDQNLIVPIFVPWSLACIAKRALTLDCQLEVGGVKRQDPSWPLLIEQCKWTSWSLDHLQFYSLTAWSHFDPGCGCQYSRYIHVCDHPLGGGGGGKGRAGANPIPEYTRIIWQVNHNTRMVLPTNCSVEFQSCCGAELFEEFWYLGYFLGLFRMISALNTPWSGIPSMELRVLKQPPQFWHNSQLSSSITNIANAIRPGK